MHSLGTLRKLYFTNNPLGYDKFNSDLGFSFDTFLKNLYNNPNYQNSFNLVFLLNNTNHFLLQLHNLSVRIKNATAKNSR